MIQLNLLPTVKLEFIKAKRAKRMVLVISFLAVAVSVTLVIVMFSLTMFQKRHISDLDKDIKTAETKMLATPDLAKILTIQSQLNSLPTLYSDRPVVSRLFPYLQQTTPSGIGITDMTIDFTESTLSIEGKSAVLELVNRYADTLKFTDYTVKPAENEQQAPPARAFSEVVLAEFARDDKGTTFTLKLKFDPIIFDSTKEVTLAVPATITTRSETELPDTGVFQQGTEE